MCLCDEGCELGCTLECIEGRLLRRALLVDEMAANQVLLKDFELSDSKVVKMVATKVVKKVEMSVDELVALSVNSKDS